MEISDMWDSLITEIEKLEEKYKLSQNLPEDYFEPGNMEYLDKYRGVYNKENNLIGIKTDIKGLRYEGRTLKLENLRIGDSIHIKREK